MRFLGSITKLVAAVFSKNSFDITLRENQSTTFTAARDNQLPPGDSDHVLVSASSTQTLTNKSIDADTNTITNIENADIKAAAAIAVNKLAAVTVNRALASDASGFITPSATTSTELGYVSGVTSAIQTQLNALGPAATQTLTNKTIDADLNTITNIDNNEIKAGAAIAVNKLAATTASRALASDGSGFITASATTSTELGYVSGVTSAIQTQIDGKASTALSNLASVAINTTLVSDTNNTDDLGTSAIGWREGFINKLSLDSNSQTTSIQGSASASASVTYSLPAADGTAGQALITNGTGGLSFATVSSSGVTTNASAGSTTVTTGTTLFHPTLTISSGHTYTIDSGATLLVMNGLTVDGTLTNNGEVITF